jgi:two-component system, OmpR family, response regulator
MNNLMVAPHNQPFLPHDQSLALSGLSVLVVDDDPDTRLLLSFLLEEAGAAVMEAASVNEAIALLENHQFDILISDVLLAGENGFDLIRHMQQLKVDQADATVAIAVTGLAGDDDRERILQEGFHGLIKKPIEVDEFPAEVATLYRTLRANPQ